ncbi:hypothetical protein [Microvirga pakistanensis]|nr:hypothetical protein [Microvirga pakistanensis]
MIAIINVKEPERGGDRHEGSPPQKAAEQKEKPPSRRRSCHD